MYLVNALAFEAQWPEYFKSDAVHDGAFTDAYGEEHRARFMYSNVYSYLEDENAVGFIKNYSGSKYAFAALLPNEGINVNDYLAGLDGEKLNSLLLNPKRVTVRTSIPKFEAEFDSDISSVLADMGMSLAFDSERADFSEMGSYFYGSERVNIFISSVLHKTKIQVGEQGTKAGAVTVVEMSKDTAPDLGEVKTVYLNRPFIYMIIDCENAVPIFLGVINEL
jgi:serpin B